MPRSHTGYVIEVDLQDDLVMFVQNGVVEHVLNTSTGGGYTYYRRTVLPMLRRHRPVSSKSMSHVLNGFVVDSLGALWRPRFFYEGFAIHGDSYVPPEPVYAWLCTACQQ